MPKPEGLLTILQGDWIEQLRQIPDESVQMCVTSPPYFGLRKYLFAGATIPRLTLKDEEKTWLVSELEKRGIKPRC